ncbi:MAG: response regulator [Planctomycetota bacterium]|jgi:putative two-component system response regulator|nr:response regulator [Planctomycetota bacterium]
MMAHSRKLILLVDDNRTNLLTGKTALSGDYTVLTVPSAGKMLETLEWRRPDLILLDVDMPEMNGFEAIKILKERPETRDIPVIFLTAMSESANELEGLHRGAIDYIAKPFSPPLLRQRIALHLLVENQKRELQEYNDNLQRMVEAKTRTILKLQNKILAAMAEMVEGRDGTTGDHIANTQLYLKSLLSAVIGAGIHPEESREWDVELLAQSSQLHDVGKISIRDSVLKKPGKLTEDEFAEMKEHVRFGIGFIERLEDGEEDSRFLRYAKTFAAYHHEKWDGSGYPHGLSGENIPLLGRLMAIADVYDALTSERPYKKAFSHDEAIRIIVEGKGKHFDPVLAGLFEEIAGTFRRAPQAE